MQNKKCKCHLISDKKKSLEKSERAVVWVLRQGLESLKTDVLWSSKKESARVDSRTLSYSCSIIWYEKKLKECEGLFKETVLIIRILTWYNKTRTRWWTLENMQKLGWGWFISAYVYFNTNSDGEEKDKSMLFNHYHHNS